MIEFIKGRSVTFTLSFNAEYDPTNIQDIVVKIGSTIIGQLTADTVLETVNPRVFRVELSSDDTAGLKEVSYLQVFLDDAVMGVRPFEQEQIRAYTQLSFSNASVNTGSDFTLNLTVEEGSEAIAVDTVTIYNALTQAQVDDIEAFSVTATTGATTATAQAVIATAQAVIATTQATNASTSASNAATSASTASTQATNASASATSASGSATSATASASSATASASSATSSASTATTQASNASTSATSAASSASSASTSATTATTQAGIATTQATNAAISATAAATSASDAATTLASKANLASPTFTGTVTSPALILSSETASTIASFDASKNIKSLALATYPSLTELSYVKGVTSAIQTQIGLKANTASPTFTGTVTIPTLSATNDALINGLTVGRGAGSVSNNVSVGSNAGAGNTTGSNNSFIGSSSGFGNTIGNGNSFLGSNAGFSNSTGSNNVAVGLSCGRNNATGSNNLFLGVSSGRYIADGSTANTTPNNSIFIGFDARALSDSQTNQIAIGNSAIGLGSNTTVLGNSSTTFGRWWGNLLVGSSTNSGESLQVTGTTKLVGNTAVTGNLTSTNFRLSALNTAPLSATDTGTMGEIRFTSTHVFLCTATNTWVRASLSTW